jgi:hypothetical protein
VTAKRLAVNTAKHSCIREVNEILRSFVISGLPRNIVPRRCPMDNFQCHAAFTAIRARRLRGLCLMTM